MTQAAGHRATLETGRPSRRDEPARDRDVARRGRPAAALQRHAAGALDRRRTGTGCGPRTSGRRGWCRGCASGWSSPRSSWAPGWVTVDELDLDRHVRRVRLPRPARCGSCSTWCRSSPRPLDRDRPLWGALLVEGLGGGSAAYVVKTHHSATDGLGAVQLMALLHSRTASPGRTPGAAAAAAARRRESGREALAQTAASCARARPGAAGGRRRSPSRSGPSGTLDAGRARGAGAEAETASAGPSSPLLAQRSREWRFDMLDVPLAALRAAAKAQGGR